MIQTKHLKITQMFTKIEEIILFSSSIVQRSLHLSRRTPREIAVMRCVGSTPQEQGIISTKNRGLLSLMRFLIKPFSVIVKFNFNECRNRFVVVIKLHNVYGFVYLWFKHHAKALFHANELQMNLNRKQGTETELKDNLAFSLSARLHEDIYIRK